MKNDQAAALQFIERAESNARTYARTFDRMFARGALSTMWDVDEFERDLGMIASDAPAASSATR